MQSNFLPVTTFVLLAALGSGKGQAAKKTEAAFPQTAVYFSEDFDSLATKPGLLPFPSEPNGDGTDWIDLPTAQTGKSLTGWAMTKNTGHGEGGVIEWSGWTFATPAAWAAAAPGQDRDQFALGTNVIAVADSDEFDDAAGGRPFDATLSTPQIDISGATADSLTLKFDSGWRTEAQVGTITVSYDGAEAIEVLRLDAEGKAKAYSETVRVPLHNPAGAKEMKISWRKVGTNDWWWVIDNIEVNDQQPATFSVQPRVAFPAPDSATISWQAAAQRAILYYGEGKEKTLKEKRELKARDGSFEATLTGLGSATTYRYRIALLEDGKPRLSEMFDFDTRFNLSPAPVVAPADLSPDIRTVCDKALEVAAEQNGYLLILGLRDGMLATALAAKSRFHIIAADSDPTVLAAVRQTLHAAGILGHRVSVVSLGNPERTSWTDGFADLILSEKDSPPVSDEECLRLLRPDGGALLLASPRNSSAFQKAEGRWEKAGALAIFRRKKLDGAKDWTHQYGTAGNAAYTGEALGDVSATSGMAVQWIGRPGGDFGIDRQPRMPAPLAAKGRLFHQGMNRLVALNAFNGAVLWSYEIPSLRRLNVAHDCSNWCVDDEHVYLAIRDRLWMLDAKTGELRHALLLPAKERKSHDWGFVAQEDDLIVGSAVRANSAYRKFWGGEAWYDKVGVAVTQVCSNRLFGYHKSTAKGIWAYGRGLILNPTLALHDGRIYFLENRSLKLPAESNSRVSDRKLWLDLTTVCLDARTGKVLWEKPGPEPVHLTEKVGFIQAAYGIATAHGYLAVLSEGTVNESGAYQKKGAFRCTSYQKDGDVTWTTESPWSADHHGTHITHPVVTEDRLYFSPQIHDLKTGQPLGKSYGPRRGCSTVVATKNALMFRILGEGNSPLGLWNKDTGSVSRFMRLRPSCWLNTIPAQGMLLIPEGGAGCSCGGWMETSIGLSPRRPANSPSPSPSSK